MRSSKIIFLIFNLILFIFIFFNNSCTFFSVQIAKNIDDNQRILDSISKGSSSFTSVDLSKYNYNEQFVSIDSLIKNNTIISNSNSNSNSSNSSSNTGTSTGFDNELITNDTNSYNVTGGHINKPEGAIQKQQNDLKLDTEKYSITATISSINADYYPDSIILNIIINDNNNSFISGLAAPYLPPDKTQDDFWNFVIDSCRSFSQKITNLEVREIRQIYSPNYSICYVLDHSNSMGEDRALMLQQSVRYSINKIKEKDFISAIKFTEKPTIEVLPTCDKEQFKKNFKLNGLAIPKYGQGGTDILLALDSAAEMLKNVSEEYNRIIVLFSDGESSMLNYKQIVKKLKDYKIKVFTICYGNVDVKTMFRLSKDTGGEMIVIQKISDFAKAFVYIYNSLTNYYKITYRPPYCEDLHSVKLNINLKELGIESIQCASSYDKSIFHNFADIGTTNFLDIEFDYNKATIKQESIGILKNISEQLLRNSDIRIKICGHTDNIGGDEYNQKLSLLRAEAIKKELVKFGINNNRIETEGFGKTRPIAPNDTEENRRKNRRTEIIIIE